MYIVFFLFVCFVMFYVYSRVLRLFIEYSFFFLKFLSISTIYLYYVLLSIPILVYFTLILFFVFNYYLNIYIYIVLSIRSKNYSSSNLLGHFRRHSHVYFQRYVVHYVYELAYIHLHYHFVVPSVVVVVVPPFFSIFSIL